jgi:protein NRD1
LLLQQLAQSSFQPVVGNANPQPTLLSSLPNGVTSTDQSHISPRSPTGPLAVDGHRDPRRRQHDDPTPRDHDYGRGYDDRPGPNRGFPRGGYRGRGRGDGRDRWNDRGRYRDRGYGPPTHGRRSRSPSPRRGSGFSPQTPKDYGSAHSPVQGASYTATLKSPAVDVDEFGRERRQSTSEEAHSPSPGTPATSVDPRRVRFAHSPTSAGSSTVEKIENNLADVDQMSMSSDEPTSSVSATHELSKPESVDVGKESESSSQAQQQALGLEQFDISAFDYTSAQSWRTLGEMWKVTHGHTPSQEELLQFIMMGSMMQGGMMTGNEGDVADPNAYGQQQSSSLIVQQQQWGQSNWPTNGVAPAQNGGVWSEGGHHSHGYDNGNYRKGSNIGYSDAVVLGGGTEEEDVSSESAANAQIDSNADSSRAGGGGRMKRVGDRWIFVRDNTAPKT